MILHDSNSFRKGLEMEPTYDIFKRRDQGYPFWITAVETLKEARERTTSFALVAGRRDYPWVRHPEEGRAPSLTPNLVYAAILEFHAAPNSRLAKWLLQN